MKSFLHDNGLSIVLLARFIVFSAAQAVAGHHVYNDEQVKHGGSDVTLGRYLSSGHSWQVTGENRESAFLQMRATVVTSVLCQKGVALRHGPEDAYTGA